MARTLWRQTSPSSTATPTARARPACPPCSPATGVSMVSNDVTHFLLFRKHGDVLNRFDASYASGLGGFIMHAPLLLKEKKC